MDFKRVLRNNFIDELNRLYDIKGSWWQKMADDEDAFILIRNNRVHVLVNGGLLLQVRMAVRNKMICETHEEFLSLRSEKDPYVKLNKDSTEPIQRVQGLSDLSEHIGQYELYYKCTGFLRHKKNPVPKQPGLCFRSYCSEADVY